MVTHLFFDFFGTLVDYSASRTEQGYPKSYRLLVEAGTRLEYREFLARWEAVAQQREAEAVESLAEYSMHEVVARFAAVAIPGDPHPSLIEAFIDTYIGEWNAGVVYHPGLPDLLDRLARGFKLAVITNTHSESLVPDHLRKMGVDHHFDDVVTSVGHGLRKPHPEIFRTAMQRLDATPEASLYIGDSFEPDYRGSKAAGMQALLIDPERAAPIAPSERLESILDLARRLPGAPNR